VKTIINNYLKQFPPAYEIFYELQNLGFVYLIGGVLREFRDYGKIRYLRDIDIILDIDDVEACEKILAMHNPQRNSFGGYKIECNGLIVDIWLLKETWAYREGIIRCASNEYSKKLIETVFLNIDGIMFDWKNEVWYDKIYQEAMQSRILDVVLSDNPQILLNIIRAMILKNRYQMNYSERLKSIICQRMKQESQMVERLYRIQQKRYKKEILSKSDIEHELMEI